MTPAAEASAFACVVVFVLKEDVIDFAAFGWAVIDNFQLRQLERFAAVAGNRPDEVIGFLAGDVQGQEGRFIDGRLAVQPAEALGLRAGLAALDGGAGFSDSSHCSSFLRKEVPRRSEERRVGKECRCRWSP